MHYFVPDIRMPGELPPQNTIEDKLGGTPWGLDPARWPRCQDCGKSLSLLAQFIHAPERLDLGRPGRSLLLFQCNHDPGMCASWEAGAGANACLVLEPEQLLGALTPIPADAPPIEHEVRVVGWFARDDGVSEAQRERFFDEAAHLTISEEERRGVTTGTRLGGVPFWIQSPSEAPADCRFLGQLDSTLSFHTPPARLEKWVTPDRERWEGRTHVGDGPNFGDGGIAYLFLRPSEGVPEGLMFWQCG